MPILKAKKGELKALLKPPSDLDIAPVFEVQKVRQVAANPESRTSERKSAVTDLSAFLDECVHIWTNFSYVDVHRVASPGTEALWWSLLGSLIALSDSPPIAPVIHATDDPQATRSAAAVAASSGRAALRISMPYPDPASVRALVASTATDLGISPKSLDIVIDWRDTLEQYPFSIAEASTRALIAALHGEHGEVITAGTPNCDHCLKTGDWKVKRNEWLLWQALDSDLQVTYGDYALYSPKDPVPARPQYGHLRYSADEDLWVHRRGLLGGGLKKAFRECCDVLVGSGHYLGRSFSPADAKFDDMANGTVDATGAAADWRTLAVVHHMALVKSQ